MKVLHVTTNYPTPQFPIFGIFVKEQIESLKNENVDSDVFYCDGQNKGFRKYITYIPKLWFKILTNHYDVIHCHHALSAILLMMTGWPLFKKCILSYQNDPDKEWGKKFFNIFHVFFKKFIIKNQSTYLTRSKTIYLPNGCNENFFVPIDRELARKQLSLDVSKIYVLYMDSNKGFRTQKRKDRFDETLNILRNEYGYNNIESIELRNTPRELIPLYINACNFHLMSSDFEGSPNSVKECMCCNVPVVSTNVGNVKEMIGDISGCYVTDEFTSISLAHFSNLVLKSTNVFNGRNKFLSKGYSMSSVAKKLKDIYFNI